MKGAGSYNDWPYYALPPSNLSAFAVPFGVDRSISSDVSAPFMDSAESADSMAPIHFQSYGYDFFSNPVSELDSSKPYAYSGLQVLDSYRPQSPPLGFPCKDHSPTSSFAEAQPYYPSYVSSTIHDHSSPMASNLWSSTPGLPSLDGHSFGDFAYKPSELGFAGQRPVPSVPWNPNPNLSPEFKGKHVGVGTSFSSMHTDVTLEERMNQGYQDMKDSNNSDWAKCNVPASTNEANQLDDKSCWWETIKSPKVELSGQSAIQPLPLSLQTQHEAPLKLGADPGNHHLSYTDSCDKHSRHGDNPARVDTISVMPRTGLVTDLNIGKMMADGDIGHNDFYNTKEEAYHMPSPGTGCFDVGLLRRHLERNEPSSSKNALGSDKNVSRDVADHILKGRPGFQNPCANVDNLSLRLSAIEDLNSVEKSFEGGDRCNPAVDSPCWKGATAHISQYESYEVLPPGYVLLPPRYMPPEYMHRNEESFGSVVQEPQNYLREIENNVKQSCENSNSYQMHAETVYQETNSAGSPRKLSPTKFAPECYVSDCAVNAGPFETEPRCDFGLQCMNDVTKMKEISVPSAKLADCESVSSRMEHQVAKENELIYQKQHTSNTGNADAVCNVNKCLEYDISSHVAEHGLSSTSSELNTLENSTEKVSTQKFNVEVLVNTMQNLSELLLGHCLNDHCELNERECNTLKNVISNLNSCTLKNAEQGIPALQDLFNQSKTFRCAGESRQFQQNASFKRPQLTKTGPVEFENPLVAEADLCIRSGKPHGKISDSISLGNDAEMTTADNMTKALKRILSKNFHDDEGAEPQALLYKNLWLEAEAALCSVRYRARYNQMKVEMDKHSCKKRDMEKQSKYEAIPTLSQIQSPAIEVNNYPKPDSSDQDLPVLDGTNLKELSSTDMNKSQAITWEEKGSQNLHSFLQNYIVSSADKEAKEVGRNDEASVMARFHVLKARADRSPNTTNLEEPSDTVDKLAARGTEDQNQVNIYQYSPIPGENKTDYEASVVARFHILKSRLEDSGSISPEGKPLSGVESVAKGMNDTGSKIASDGKSLDTCVNPAGMHINSCTGLDWEGNQESPTHGTYEFQLPTYYSDGLASDWEHVEKGL